MLKLKGEILTYYSKLATAKQHSGKEKNSDLPVALNYIEIDTCRKSSS